MKDFLLREEVPAWYRFGLHGRTGFYVEIHHESFWEIRHHLEQDSHVVQRQQERCPGLGTFSPLFQRHGIGCGFGGVLQRVTDFDSEWIRYQGMFPLVKRIFHPKGAETDEWNVRATLRALFSTLYSFEGTTHASERQLMVINPISISRECNGGALEVICTPTLCRWINEPAHMTVWTGIENAMYQVGSHMWQQTTDRTGYEVTRLGPGLLFVVPGNACSLLPDPDERRKDNEGFTFTSYNVDSSLQQLTLFAGLARLHELASAKLATTASPSCE